MVPRARSVYAQPAARFHCLADEEPSQGRRLVDARVRPPANESVQMAACGESQRLRYDSA